MKKFKKIVVTTAVAGLMGLSSLTFVGCEKDIKEVPGKSAYEIAVEQGFTGTKEEWLESLIEEVPTTVTSSSNSYTIGEDGRVEATVTLNMSDGSQQVKTEKLARRVLQANLYNTNIILSSADAASKNITAAWDVIYDDGSCGYLPLQKEQFVSARRVGDNEESDPSLLWDGTTYEAGKVYEFTYAFGKRWYTTQTISVYICNDLTTIQSYISMSGEEPNQEPNINLNYPYYMQKNEQFDLKTMYLYQTYNLPEQGYYYLNVPVTQQMLNKTIDTSTVGYKSGVVTYNQKTYTFDIEVYDPEVTIVQDMYIQDEETLVYTITQGADLAPLKNLFIGKKLDIRYYVRVNGSDNSETTITEDMLDFSGVNLNELGVYTASINYMGYSYNINVSVQPNMTTATIEHTLTGNGTSILTLMLEGTVITKGDLYNNGYCELFTTINDSDVSLTSILGYLPYTINNNTIDFMFGNEKIAKYAVNLQENTFTSYEFTAEDGDPVQYNCIEDEAPFTINIYSNGYGMLTMDGGAIEIVVGYKIENNVLYILPSTAGSHMSFNIGADNTLTFVEGL